MDLQKLQSTHPDTFKSGYSYCCYIYPGRGSSRTISVEIHPNFPYVPPRVLVYPYEDIRKMSHILEGGEICYMHAEEWNPRLHTLSYVFSQAKRIVYEAVIQRYGI